MATGGAATALASAGESWLSPPSTSEAAAFNLGAAEPLGLVKCCDMVLCLALSRAAGRWKGGGYIWITLRCSLEGGYGSVAHKV